MKQVSDRMRRGFAFYRFTGQSLSPLQVFTFSKRLPPVGFGREAIFLNSNADIRFALNLLLRNRFGFRAKRAEPRSGPAP